MICTNEKKLPCQSAVAKIKSMFVSENNYTFMDGDGYGHMMNAHGGINYTQQLGDSCMDLCAALPVAGVSLETVGENKEAKIYGCLGNEIVITTGSASGKKGLFTGKIFGGDYFHAYFPKDVLEQMNGEEHFLVKCQGAGFQLTDYPEIEMMNISADCFHRLGVIENCDGTLSVPVTHILPHYIMGEGWGNMSFGGDEIDISTDDPGCFSRFNLGSLRFGDVVYVQDLDSTHGTSFIAGSCSVGVIVHGDGAGMGFGPGFMAIMSSKKPLIKPIQKADANLAAYYHISKEG